MGPESPHGVRVDPSPAQLPNPLERDGGFQYPSTIQGKGATRSQALCLRQDGGAGAGDAGPRKWGTCAQPKTVPYLNSCSFHGLRSH